MGRHITIPVNEQGRDFVVGDIHGEYDKLVDALNAVNFNEEVDRLFSVGDLIDRGPQSLRCLQLIDEPWFFSVLGNHEQMAYDSLINPLFKDDIRMQENWVLNGGAWFVQHDIEEVKSAVKKISNLPLTITVGDVGIVHANPPHDWNSRKDVAEVNLIWGRTKIRNKESWIVENIGRVYLGHTPIEVPVNLGNCRYIDTAACYGGKVTVEEVSVV